MTLLNMISFKITIGSELIDIIGGIASTIYRTAI